MSRGNSPAPKRHTPGYVEYEIATNPFLVRLRDIAFVLQVTGGKVPDSDSRIAFLVPTQARLEEMDITSVSVVFAQQHTIQLGNETSFFTLGGVSGFFSDSLDSFSLASITTDVLRQISVTATTEHVGDVGRPVDLNVFLIANVIGPLTSPSIQATQSFREERSLSVFSSGSGHYSSPAKAAYTFKDFQAKMQCKEATPLVLAVKKFVRDVTLDSSPVPVPRELHAFMGEVFREVLRNPLWVGASIEELDGTKDGLEKYVMTKIWQRCFPLHEGEDKKLVEIISKYKADITPGSLEVSPGILQQRQWSEAVGFIRSINDFKTPKDKLICVSNACKTIIACIRSDRQTVGETVEANNFGADDFLPCLLLVVFTAEVPNYVSNIRYIQDYRNPSRLHSEDGYFLTSAVSAYHFWLSYEPNAMSSLKAQQNQTPKITSDSLPSMTDGVNVQLSEFFVAPPEGLSAKPIPRPSCSDRDEKVCMELDSLPSLGDLKVSQIEHLWEQYRRLRRNEKELRGET